MANTCRSCFLKCVLVVTAMFQMTIDRIISVNNNKKHLIIRPAHKSFLLKYFYFYVHLVSP